MLGRTLAALLVLVLVLVTSGTSSAAPFAFITNTTDSTTSRLDVATHEAITIPVALEPEAVAVTPDGSRAWVSHGLSGIVSVLDGENASLLHSVGVGGILRGIAVNLEGTRAWVGNDAGSIDVVDGITGMVADTLPVPFTNFFGAATNPQGTRAYFGAADFAGTLVVVDTTTDAIVTNTVVSFVSVPAGVAVNPSGTRVWVALPNTSEVAVVDATTNLLLDTIPLSCDPMCPEPRGITVSPDGQTVYVAAFQRNGVVVIDTATLAEVDFIETDAGPVGLDVTPDGERLYVANSIQGTVSVVDTGSRTVIGTLAGFGGARAFGPFIGGPAGTVEPPLLDAPARKCQTAVGAGFTKLAGKAHKLVASCLDKVQLERAVGSVSSATAGACARDLDVGNPSSKVARLRLAEIAKILSKCGNTTAAALGPPCDTDATDLATLAGCVTDRQLESAGRAIAASYAGACALLAEVSLDEVVPGVCGP